MSELLDAIQRLSAQPPPALPRLLVVPPDLQARVEEFRRVLENMRRTETRRLHRRRSWPVRHVGRGSP